MQKAKPIFRILLGLIFFVFGLMFFFTAPPELPDGNMKTFMMGMGATGYFFYLLKCTEVLMGALLLLNRFVPLALIILAPISLNIFMVNALMAPEGLVMAIGILILHVGLGVMYMDKFKPILQAKN